MSLRYLLASLKKPPGQDNGAKGQTKPGKATDEVKDKRLRPKGEGNGLARPRADASQFVKLAAGRSLSENTVDHLAVDVG